MNLDEFQSDRAGDIEFREEDGERYPTFEPRPLPPDNLEYSEDLVRLIEEAASNLNELSGVGRRLPNPHIFIRPYILKEAVLSSRIEGTQASFEDAVIHDEETLPEEKELQFDIQEVHNYQDALQHGIERVGKERLDIGLLQKLHGQLMQGVRGEGHSPGEFRDIQAHIGDIGAPREDATFIPMAPEQIQPAMDDLMDFLNTEVSMPYLVKSSLMHYQFEAIHPFEDGNGRMGRLLIILDMVRKGKLSQPLLYLSEYFSRNKMQYYDRLQRVSTDGEYEEWIKFFLRAVKNQAKDSRDRAVQVITLQDQYRDRLREEGIPDRCIELMELTFDLQPRTINEVKEELDVSYGTARNYVHILEDHGILGEINSGGRATDYIATELFQIMQEESEVIRTAPEG